MLDSGLKSIPAMDLTQDRNQENSIEFLEPRASSFLLSPPRVWEFDPGIQTVARDLRNQVLVAGESRENRPQQPEGLGV